MKAFLMHRDRDFDPERILSRRERTFRREEHPELNLRRILPWNSRALRQDLSLDVLFAAMAKGETFLAEVAQAGLLTTLTDVDAIRYRQQVFVDCLKNEPVVREIYQIALDAVWHEMKNPLGFLKYPNGILLHSINMLEMFAEVLKRLRVVAGQQQDTFRSEGFTRFFAMVRQELDDEYFATIEGHLDQLRFRPGVLISGKLGKGNKGDNYVLRTPGTGEQGWITRLRTKRAQFSFKIDPRDEAGAKALSELNDEGINLVANALAQSTDHILSFFQMVRTELAFYIGCLNLHHSLVRLGEPTCIPDPRPVGERGLSASGLYNASLALSMRKEGVGNDLKGGGKNLFVITGANSGGKSTLLGAIGAAYLMMQAGMPVAAESFAADVCAGVFSHYKREEDATMEKGKWDEELGRMSEIIDQIKPDSLLLFNESFASTNEREGSEIAGQIVRALLTRRIKIFFVTHLYAFAKGLVEHGPDGTLFLRAERNSDGTRSFKLKEAAPLETSYGEDLYQSIFGAPDRP
ncbi:MAG TPA: DNA mismatch repair protein MutS [Blastocatellia bacterium]